MEDYALKIGKAIKKEANKNKNSLKCLTGIIKKQEPLTVEAFSGNLSFVEGINLRLEEGVKEKMLKDPDRQEYLGREILLIGIQDFTAFAILA